MADKNKRKKRKIFTIPDVAELDKIVEVEPVFTRQKKSQHDKIQSVKSAEKTSCAASTSGEVRVAMTDTAESCQEKTEKLDETTELGQPGDEKATNQERGKDTGDVQVGRNFLETFAFIENTKFYKGTESRSAEPEEKAGQTIPVKSSKPNAVIVNQRQKGNPLLKFFQNVPWEYGDVVPDYVMAPTMCALFLSIRYHNFNPEYIHDRLKKLGNRYELRVLLVQIDVKDHHKTLKELTKIALLADLTLILAWRWIPDFKLLVSQWILLKNSNLQPCAEEAARYIEMYKVYENKPPDALQSQVKTDYMSQLSDCLTTVKSVNKTDVVTLISTFKSLTEVISASTDDMALCPGFGPLKAKRLHDTFNQPFIVNKTTGASSDAQTKT